ncbi:ankyrin repeat domain-containing protein 22-like [Mytilus californianus]|uniref:ankyrin repeat domain-containing protein 22-like n=1 Tax=Mytilus californianus TaxID=6549 RepID=UPI0022462BA7|nr:ankyrin repeat domain-containing protein 22-like [Mytilus californianus]
MEICKLLHNSGANINTGDISASTPLHVACREKHERIVKFLIEYNANVNAVNRKKESALYTAYLNLIQIECLKQHTHILTSLSACRKEFSI